MDVGSLIIDIGVDASALMNGINQVSSVLEKLGPSVQKLSDTKVNIPRTSVDVLSEIEIKATQAKEAMYAFNETKLDSQKEQLASLKREMQGLISSCQYNSKEFTALKQKYDQLDKSIKETTTDTAHQADTMKQLADTADTAGVDIGSAIMHGVVTLYRFTKTRKNGHN